MGKRIPKILSKHEIELIREGCHTSVENALFEFLYSAGCRIGEVAKLNRDDINFLDNSVIVNGKDDKVREVYFNIPCSIWLKRYYTGRVDDELCLMVTVRNAMRRMSVDSLRRRTCMNQRNNSPPSIAS